eukprot:gene10026-2200_t
MGRKAATKAAAKSEQRQKALHPTSRKAKQMNKKYLRKSKLIDQKRSSNFKQFKKGVDILWFREHLPQDVTVLTKDQLAYLTSDNYRYVKRFDDEIKSLEEQQKSKHRCMMLSERAQHEMRLFCGSHGIDVPDLTDPDNVQRLREWQGELNAIPTIKRTVIKKE